MYDVGNPDPGLGQAHKKCDGLNLDHNPPPLDNWISNKIFSAWIVILCHTDLIYNLFILICFFFSHTN